MVYFSNLRPFGPSRCSAHLVSRVGGVTGTPSSPRAASPTLDATQARPPVGRRESGTRADHDGAPEHRVAAVEQARHGHRARFITSFGPDD